VQAHLVLTRALLSLFGAQARERVESALETCAALVEQTDARVYEPQIHGARGALAGALGDDDARERWLRTAHRPFAAMGATGDAERVMREIEVRS
jgi:hypothetical protein